MFMFACGSKPDNNAFGKDYFGGTRTEYHVRSSAAHGVLHSHKEHSLHPLVTSCQFICLVTNLISNLFF